MPESPLAVIQRKQIEIAVGELLLTSDFYMRLEIVERDGPRVRTQSAGEHLDERALAGPVVADEPDDLTGEDLEVRPAQGVHLTEALGDALGGQQDAGGRLRHGGSSLRCMTTLSGSI